MRRYFCIILGRLDVKGDLRVGALKFENWHLYRLGETHTAKNPKNKWVRWERVF